MAFLFSPFLEAAEATVFFIVQGDASYRYVDRSEGRHQVRDNLQYEIAEELRAKIQSTKEINAILFFETPDETAPFIEVYKQGILVAKEIVSENFTDPATLADVLNRGYELVPAHRYFLFYWGYTIPSYPQKGFDMSHPEEAYDVSRFKKALELAGSYQLERRFESLVFSTCYNSSLELLSAVYPFTRYVIASEIYLHNRGLSADFLDSIAGSQDALSVVLDIYTKSLLKLNTLIPKGPASEKPILDYSVTALDMQKFEVFYENLLNVFNVIHKNINEMRHLDLIGKSFRHSLLRSSKKRIFQSGFIDIKTLIESAAPLMTDEDYDSFHKSYADLVLFHKKMDPGNYEGVNLYFPFDSFEEMKALRATPSHSLNLARILDSLIVNYFLIFGVPLNHPYPKIFSELSLFYENHIPAHVVRAFLTGLQSKGEVVIDQFTDVEFKGTLDDLGNYFGRVGTHKLVFLNHDVIFLRHSKGRGHLDKMLSNEPQRLIISGQLKVVSGLWDYSRRVVLEVHNIMKITQHL